MPALAFTLAEIPIQLVSSSAALLELLADYFRYYQPVTHAQLKSQISNQALHLTLEFCDVLPTRQSLLSPAAQLISHTGAIRLWHEAAQSPTPGEAESSRFYFDAGVAAFQLDTQAGHGMGYITPAALDYPRVLANTYTLFPLLLLLRARGIYHLHAAAVVSPSGKLCLLPGAPRAGKTTLTTALALGGWQPLADDSLLLDTRGAHPRLWPLRKEFHVDEQLLTQWPGLANVPVRHRYLGRACIAALEFFGTEALAQQPFAHVDAVVLPQITGADDSRSEALPASEALLKLAEQSVYLQLWRAHTARQFDALARLLQSAVTRRCLSGRDLWAQPLQAAVVCGAGLG